MERLVASLFIAWLVLIGVGVVSALMPLILFVVGFFAMLLILAILGRFVASLLW